MMNFWYDQNATIASLISLNELDNVFNFVLQNVQKMQNDFEIKRLIIGLTTLTMSAGSSNLDSSVQGRFAEFISAIVFLCQKSLALREKKQRKIEEAIED